MKHKKVVVIGGSSGIGKSIVERLKSEGAEVTTYSRSSEGDFHLDATSDFKEIKQLPDVIDGLVYCPGTINLKPFHRLTIDQFKEDLEVNFFGAVKVLQACFKGLKQANKPSVVLFSTVAVSMGMGFHSSIASSKGAVEGLVKSLAAEWSPNGIRVNAVAPSLTDTPLAGQLLSSDEKKEAAKKRHPLGRFGDPEEMAAAVSYLLSDSSSWMTGQILRIDGGMSSVRGV
ncbi:SDR family NAD(P)-dependent oxidoreductase [Belliella kenyensis]|uniref:SDR family NAD(P)-dependent oxidoreductase n=1 Tax=Belliella kenyensis TaxID=1472724 RepID=A0ABV8EJ00_9BACT|nr:SDR family oxidoreductase [Belliella kenyensis]MCH7403096.1 SDR family oxidoreductase [Belliella kenyensis]MDN3602265.1 SDR family oxidoreductase [Belliella kenyensis]